MEGTCKVMTLGTCKCEASGFGSESSDVVLNPFISLPTLQRPKRSINTNWESNKFDQALPCCNEIPVFAKQTVFLLLFVVEKPME